MQGLEFSVPVADVIKLAQAKGLILINAGSNILRFVPPLICSKENVDEMAAIMEEVLKDLDT
jgi:acetylornithine/N-succinyldiaminopimelate aminotransferase